MPLGLSNILFVFLWWFWGWFCLYGGLSDWIHPFRSFATIPPQDDVCRRTSSPSFFANIPPPYTSRRSFRENKNEWNRTKTHCGSVSSIPHKDKKRSVNLEFTDLLWLRGWDLNLMTSGLWEHLSWHEFPATSSQGGRCFLCSPTSCRCVVLAVVRQICLSSNPCRNAISRQCPHLGDAVFLFHPSFLYLQISANFLFFLNPFPIFLCLID